MYEKFEAICDNCEFHFAVVYKPSDDGPEFSRPSFCPFCSNALSLEE